MGRLPGFTVSGGMFMPIYEYACDDCKKTFEVLVGVRDGAVQECTYCSGRNIRKLISNCSFQLKGSGWYVTDYARKDAAASNGKKSPAGDQSAAASSDSSSGSSETAATPAEKASSSTASSEKAA
jgi:putative FmdB family regulatory protein